MVILAYGWLPQWLWHLVLFVQWVFFEMGLTSEESQDPLIIKEVVCFVPDSIAYSLNCGVVIFTLLDYGVR